MCFDMCWLLKDKICFCWFLKDKTVTKFYTGVSRTLISKIIQAAITQPATGLGVKSVLAIVTNHNPVFAKRPLPTTITYHLVI